MCISCTRSSRDPAYTFIVPSDSVPPINTNDKNTPPKPPIITEYYLPYDFIIDTAGEIYFYQQEQVSNDVEFPCCPPPEFINLQPKDIVKISVDQIDEFLNLNILSFDRLNKFVSIASTCDTIQSEGIFKIITALNKNHFFWRFRKATQEERIVLYYKKKQLNYLPNEIKWDTTKIKLRKLYYNTGKHLTNYDCNIKFHTLIVEYYR